MSQSAFLPVKPYILIGNHVRVKSSGLARGLANARPPGSATFANVQPRDWQGGQMPRSCPEGGGDWAQVELIDALPEKAKNIIKYS